MGFLVSNYITLILGNRVLLINLFSADWTMFLPLLNAISTVLTIQALVVFCG